MQRGNARIGINRESSGVAIPNGDFLGIDKQISVRVKN